MATGAKAADPAGEGHEEFLAALGTANAGEAVLEIAALEELPHDRAHDRPPKAIALLITRLGFRRKLREEALDQSGPASLLPVQINEWMADNAGPGGFPDPADGLFQDWFELFNPNLTTVPLGDLYLTDDLDNPVRWRIPTNTFIGAGGFLLVWADNNPEQNPVGGGTNIDLHAPFSLRGGGEAIGLFARDGITPLSTITFGPQGQNVSGGWFPDGDTNSVRVMTNWTPRAANTQAAFPVLELVDLSRDAGGIMFRWNTVPGRAYQIQAAPGLPATQWTPVGAVIRATGPTASGGDNPGAGSRFYRVIQLP